MTISKNDSKGGAILCAYLLTYRWLGVICPEPKKIVRVINSQAGGMAVAQPYGFEIDFVRDPFSGSAA